LGYLHMTAFDRQYATDAGAVGIKEREGTIFVQSRGEKMTERKKKSQKEVGTRGK